MTSLGLNSRNMLLLSHIVLFSKYALLSRIEFCRQYVLFDSDFYSEKTDFTQNSKQKMSVKAPGEEPGRRRRSRSLRGKTWGEEARQAGRAVSDSFEETTTSAQDPATFERWTWGWWWSRILIQDVSTFDFFQQPWRCPLVWSQWNWGCSIWEQSPGFLKIKLMVSFWQIEEEEQQWNRYLSIYDRSMK